MLRREYSFPPPTDNSDVILLNRMHIIKKNNNIWIQNLLGAESRTCKQSSITNAKAKAKWIRLVYLGKTQTLGVRWPLGHQNEMKISFCVACYAIDTMTILILIYLVTSVGNLINFKI